MGEILSFPIAQTSRQVELPARASSGSQAFGPPASGANWPFGRTAAQSVAAAAAALRAAHADCLSTMAFNKACQDAIATGDVELMTRAHAELSRRLTVDRDGRLSIVWLDLPAARPRA